MLTRQEAIHMDYQAVLEKIEKIKNEPALLLDMCLPYANHFPMLLDKMVTAIDLTLKESDETINSLGDQEAIQLIQVLRQFPYILLENKHEETWELCAAVILLIANYLTIFPNESLAEANNTLYTLYATNDHFKTLILASEFIIDRYESLINSQIDMYGLSQTFTERLLKSFMEGEDKK